MVVRLRSLALIGLLCATACGRRALAVYTSGVTVDEEDGPTTASGLPGCSPNDVPARTLACTGLFADPTTKQLAPEVYAYAPGAVLWSDGAEKQRWISFPAGTVIDNSDRNEWLFPIGTKVWKQFSKGGRRVETRLWQKVDDKFWVNAAYAWNADETAAVLSAGGDVTVDGGTYHIPTQEECEKCHRGRPERILGFEEVSLGLPAAAGLTLEELVRRGLLVKPPAAVHLSIGDDGTGLAAPALSWFHANCGVTCHNENETAAAFGALMNLRLDPRALDGSSTSGVPSVKTTVGVEAHSPSWRGRARIAAGAPERSLIYDLISHRGTGMQMPPIATRVVDEASVTVIAEWIRRLGQ